MEKKSSGCVGGAVALVIGVIVLVLVVVFGVVGLFWNVKRDAAYQEAEAVATMSEMAALHGHGHLEIEEDEWKDLKPLKAGEPVSIERYLFSMIDQTATELAKENFRTNAEGAPIQWALKLRNVREAADGIVGEFELPYMITRSDGSGYGSTLNITATFDEGSRDALLELRRGDWVNVSGQLSLEGNGTSILEARLPAE
ncbi:hypothetical protein [Haloferula helveola]